MKVEVILMENKQLANITNTEMEESNLNGLFDDNLGNMIANLGSTKKCYNSFKLDTPEDKVAFYNMVNNTNAKLKDHINEEFTLKNVYIEVIQCEQVDSNGELTGVKEDCPRIVLASDDNKAYQCVSFGVLSSLNRIFGIFGFPNQWKGGLKVKAKSVSTKNGRSTLVLELVSIK